MQIYRLIDWLIDWQINIILTIVGNFECSNVHNCLLGKRGWHEFCFIALFFQTHRMSDWHCQYTLCEVLGEGITKLIPHIPELGFVLCSLKIPGISLFRTYQTYLTFHQHKDNFDFFGRTFGWHTHTHTPDEMHVCIQISRKQIVFLVFVWTSSNVECRIDQGES